MDLAAGQDVEPVIGFTQEMQMTSVAEQLVPSSTDRVRRSTPAHLNEQIDRQTDSNIQSLVNSSHATIRKRLRELDNEWDVERVLEANAATLALTGLALGATVNRKWLALPAVIMSFLLQHSLQGWCPPLPLLRQLGVRTRAEIEREKYELIRLMQRR
jgi:hypothetical protein